MTDTTVHATTSMRPEPRATFAGQVGAVLGRHMLVLRRNPALAAATLLGPVSLVLMFGYVFGGAIAGADIATYRSNLIASALVLTAGTSLVIIAADTARDVKEGMTPRVLAMPVSRLAILLGATVAQLLVSVVLYAVMIGVGLLTGWRWQAGFPAALAGLGLLVLFGYALSWLGVHLGLVIRDEQVIQQLASLILGTVLFSNAMVPVETMPGVPRAIAEWNPFSAVVSAVRYQFGTAPVADGPWPLAHPVLATVGWSVLLLAAFVPLATRRLARQG
ncbi:MAG: ABC transporter permease [Intrasporangium sp.]|uniref:ABC transporter permease n=1 Tax=Intrasporangium sp. TaxID=1925024 RepID=UPI0026494280|nr:ABC transporter permease [Intrasporangium sp.]MDN5798312.1 ABC transporter permease [Intrasporangium sp.]